MLRTRLYLGLLGLLLLLVAVGMYSLKTTRDLGHAMAAVMMTNARGLLIGQQLKDQANVMASELRDRRRGLPAVERDPFEATRAAFSRALHEQGLLAPQDTERAARLEAISVAFEQLASRVEIGGQGLRPFELMKEDEAAVFGLLSALSALGEHDERVLRHASDNALGATRRTTRVFAIGVSGAVLFAGVFAWGLSRALLQPIGHLNASARALGEGKLDHEVQIVSNDELGELARTFNTMAARLRSYRDAMAEKALRAQRTMEATLTTAPDPLFVISREGHVITRNPAAENLAGLPELADGFPASINDALHEVLSTRLHYLPAGYDRLITLRDRHYLPRILAVGDELTDFRGAAVILQDVTKFRLLDDAKANLVGTVSHELKTPLTGLRMALYLMLEQSGLTATQKDLLETARDDADRLLRILDDLLDLSRLEAGVAAPTLQETEVEDLLERIVREVKPITDAASQTVTLAVARDIGGVRVDPDAIRHVFINFLSNASKYSPPSSEITLYAKPSDDGFVRFGVLDQGPGVPEGSLVRVFDKFYRVPGQTKKGVGLGLAISREIVVAHGGSIACAARAGGGSDFYFLLPTGRVSAH